jgi:hypothetical protein
LEGVFAFAQVGQVLRAFAGCPAFGVELAFEG